MGLCELTKMLLVVSRSCPNMLRLSLRFTVAFFLINFVEPGVDQQVQLFLCIQEGALRFDHIFDLALRQRFRMWSPASLLELFNR